MTHSPESLKPRSAEQAKERLDLPKLMKSRDFFEGNLLGEAGPTFRVAARKAQEATGFSMTPDEFGQYVEKEKSIDQMTASEALDAFDKGYAEFVYEQLGASEEEIELATNLEEEPAEDEFKTEAHPEASTAAEASTEAKELLKEFDTRVGSGHAEERHEFVESLATYIRDKYYEENPAERPLYADNLEAFETALDNTGSPLPTAEVETFLQQVETDLPPEIVDETIIAMPEENEEAPAALEEYDQTLAAFEQAAEERPELLLWQAEFKHDLVNYLEQKYPNENLKVERENTAREDVQHAYDLAA